MSKKELKKNETTQLDMFADTAVPAHIDQSSGRGSEDVGADDITIPRLGLCQSLSPQRKKNDPDYIAGIEEGDLFNTLTGELYGKSIIVVPVYFVKEYTVWLKRDGGGSKNGFRGSHPTELAAIESMKLLEDGHNCEIVETAINYCLAVRPDGSTEEIVVSMAKSQMKASRKWNSLIRVSGGDRFSRGYELSGVEVSSEKGDYFNYGIRQLGFTPEDVYRKAEHLYEEIRSGAKRAAAESSGRDIDGEATDAQFEDDF